MDAPTLVAELCRRIDEHRWDELAPLLSPDLRCRYVHTGEELDRDTWIRLNAEYPGFDRMVVEDLVGHGDRAVARCHVTAEHAGVRSHFEVASFVTAAEGVIQELTEVWTSVGQAAPEGTRPQG